jgi:cyclic pyranopterin phosphate synthase
MIMDEKPRVVYWLNDNLYLNITNRCSNNCWFCFRNFKKGVGGFNLKLREEPAVGEIISELKATLTLRHWKEVVFCGFGEPTARLDVLLEITRWIRRQVGAVIVRVNTNGHGYALNKVRDVARELKMAGVDKVSVSLNGWDEETYGANCRPEFVGAFEIVTDFVKKAVEASLQVEISAVRMPEVNIEKVQEIAKSLGAPLRIREYVPCFW